MSKTYTLSLNDIKEGLIKVSKSGTLFPSDAFSRGQLPDERCLTVVLPDGSEYLSDVFLGEDNKPKYLRNRSPLKNYFKQVGARKGDIVTVAALAPRRYELRFRHVDVSMVPGVVSETTAQASLPLTPGPIDDEVRNDAAHLEGDTCDVGANSQSDEVSGNLDDLFSASDDIGIPDRALKVRSEFRRDAALRRTILKSANGRCEHCGRQGFLLQNGLRYLEVHHIIALANDGQDTEINLIALCPEHHREAHFGAHAEELEKRFLERVRRRARTQALATT
ncbi:hypothetical protein A9R05_22220 [Burkholderia sp. KK1]|nr:hypothetical protein A9R05_22220 [Burkholderia sp. KK1]